MIDIAREHLKTRRIADALRAYSECEFDDAACDIWRCHMLAGDFESAWRTADEIERRSPTRVWNGEWFEGKRVLIRCVHGLGDTIQFIRYARELKKAGAVSVVAQMHPELVELIGTAPDLDAAITWGPRPEFDIEIEAMELPWAFRTSCANVPCTAPYLFPPAERTASRAARFDFCRAQRSPEWRPVQFDDSDHFRVALIWSSSTWDETRSLPLDLLESAFRDIPGISLYSLQHGPDYVQAAGRNWLRHTGEQSSDILDTAADLMNVDLLISVDTMAAHLAGALARPVWMLLKHDADWRWMLDRCDSPWYPTMRLFRQPTPGDWAAAVREIAAELGIRLNARNGNRSGGIGCPRA